MVKKDLITSGRMTQLLIGNWLLWSIVFFSLYKIILNITEINVESIVLIIIMPIVVHGIIIFLAWKLSTTFSFKKKTIAYDDVTKVMKNLIIFSIVICILAGIYDISKVNSLIYKEFQSNYEKYKEGIMSQLYSDAQMKEYEAKKEQKLKETKNKLYTYLIIYEIGITVVFMAELPLEKKEILKYVRLEEKKWT
mgnify:CR=1 FL=1